MMNAFITIKVQPKYPQPTGFSVNLLDEQLATPLNDVYITVQSNKVTKLKFAAINGQIIFS
jgi:hypothetical protein